MQPEEINVLSRGPLKDISLSLDSTSNGMSSLVPTPVSYVDLTKSPDVSICKAFMQILDLKDVGATPLVGEPM